MGAVDLDDLEAHGQRPARGLGEGIDQLLDLRQGELAGHGIALALRQRARGHGLPGGLGAGLGLDRLGAVPGAERAGAPSGMGELDARHRAMSAIGLDHALQPGELAVVIDAGAAMGDAPVPRHAGGLDEGGRQPAGGEARMMAEMPILHATLHRLVLAHGREHGAVAQGQAAQLERRKENGLAHGGTPECWR